MHRGIWLCFLDDLLHIWGHRVSLMSHEQVSGRSRGWWEGIQGRISWARSLRWESALLLDVTQSSQDSQPLGEMESQEQGLPTFSWLFLSFTHTGLLPMQTFSLSENSCSRFTLYLLLSDCVHLIVFAMFFLLLWPHCHYLQLKKLFRVLNGAGALVSPHMDSVSWCSQRCRSEASRAMRSHLSPTLR